MKISNAYLINVIVVVLIFNFVIIVPWSYRYNFETHNLHIMEYLDDPSIQQAIRNNMTETYNFTQLFEWEHKYLHWVDIGEIENRTLDPREILKSEKGHCGEFSLVYLTACLSLEYQARWMVSVRPFNYSGLHNWVEVMYNGSWVHVDPTEKIWDNPSMYSDRDWWGVIGRDALVFAFEKGKFKDVTSKYM